MSRARIRTVLVSLLVALLWSSAAHAESLTVRVVNIAEVTDQTLTAAFTVADGVFRSAGFSIAWQRCVNDTACQYPLAPDEVWLRVAGTARHDVQITPYTLGYSVIGQGPGTLSTVFVDPITRLARRAYLSTPQLLGGVMAHELAHLIQGRQAPHARSGVMRRQWSIETLLTQFRASLQFSAEESAALRAGYALRWVTDAP